ncbi:hypothetical protein Tco_1190267 [Tanacetum coccineum]
MTTCTIGLLLSMGNQILGYSQFHSIANDVYTTFFEKAEPEIAQPEKEKQDEQDLHADTDVIEIGSSSSKLECLSTSELECSSTSESELSSYVSSYDELSLYDEYGCLEKSVPGSIKMTVSQKGPSKDLLNWYEDVNDQDEEEIDEDDDKINKQDDEIDEETEDGKDDSDDELWSLKTIGTTTKKFINPKIKVASSNSTPSTKKLVKRSEPHWASK